MEEISEVEHLAHYSCPSECKVASAVDQLTCHWWDPSSLRASMRFFEELGDDRSTRKCDSCALTFDSVLWLSMADAVE